MKRDRILVIDGDVNTREHLSILLKGMNFAVLEADTSEAAVSAVRQHREDLFAVFQDLYLRGHSPDLGMGLLKELKNDFPDIPVVVYSAVSSKEAVNVMMHGAHGFLDKVKVSDDDFAAVVQSLLQTWQRVDDRRAAEASRTFLQDIIDSIPYEIMVRDEDGYVLFENKVKSDRFGGPLKPGEKVQCKTRYDINCKGEPCACKDAFDTGKWAALYYRWKGLSTLPGADLFLEAALVRRGETRPRMAVETARDVSCQVGFQELMQQIAALEVTDRQSVLEAVVGQFTGIATYEGAHAYPRVGFTRARAYLVTPRGSEETMRLCTFAGHPKEMDKTRVVFHRSRSRILTQLWANPDEVRRVLAKEFEGNVETAPYEIIGRVETVVWIPICVGQRLEGLVVADKLGKRDPYGNPDEEITWEELHWCKVLSRFLSQVFGNIYQYEGSRWLLETEHQMAAAGSLEKMYEVLLDATQKYFVASISQVHLVRNEKQLFMVRGTDHAENCPLAVDGHPLNIGVNARACRLRKIQLVPDCATDADYQEWERKYGFLGQLCQAHTIPARSIAAVPFATGARVVGSLCLLFHVQRSFDELDERLLEGLAAGISAAAAAVEAHVTAIQQQVLLSGQAAGLSEFYKALVSARSENDVIRYCLTYLTAQGGLAFNRVLFFRQTPAGESEFKLGFGQADIADFRQVGATVKEMSLAQLLRESLQVHDSALLELLNGLSIPAETDLGTAMVNTHATPFSTDRIQGGQCDRFRDMAAKINMHDFLAIGLHVQNKPFGGFVVDRPFMGGLRHEDRGFLATFTVEAGRALENFQREQELTEQREWAVIARVAGLVRHDLIQPLAGMAHDIDCLNVAIGKKNMADCRDIAASLSAQREDAAQLADALLDFCGRDEKTVELMRVVKTSVKLAERSARLVEARLGIIEAPVSLSGFRGSPGALVRGVFNILDNSIEAIRMRKATDDPAPYSGKINIRLMASDNELTLTVEDNGIGMKPELVSILNSGSRLVSTREGPLHGHGYEVIRAAVIRNRGKLRVESQFGFGTTVTLRFQRPAGG